MADGESTAPVRRSPSSSCAASSSSGASTSRPARELLAIGRRADVRRRQRPPERGGLPARALSPPPRAGGDRRRPSSSRSRAGSDDRSAPRPKLAAAQADHPFFQGVRVSLRQRPGDLRPADAQGDMALIDGCSPRSSRSRRSGRGRLAEARRARQHRAGGRASSTATSTCTSPRPASATSCWCIGDLHGCYSCLKAALLQADFFAKVQAYHGDPEKNPEMSLVLLGDYIDRGRFSYNGVLRTVMQLFVAVPEHVYRAARQPRVLRRDQRQGARPGAALRGDERVADRRADEVFATYMRLFEALPNIARLRPDALRARRHPARRHHRREVEGSRVAQRPGDPLPDAVERSERGRRDARSTCRRRTPASPSAGSSSRASSRGSASRTLIRGHERVVEGFRTDVRRPRGDAPHPVLRRRRHQRRSAPRRELPRGHADGADHQARDGVSELTPFAIDYERFNDPKVNAFFREQIVAALP